MTTINKLRIIQLKRQHSKANIQLSSNLMKSKYLNQPPPLVTCDDVLFFNKMKWFIAASVIQNPTICHIQHYAAVVCGGIGHFHISAHKIALIINVLCQNDCILWRIIKRKWKSLSTKNAMHELVERYALYS